MKYNGTKPIVSGNIICLLVFRCSGRVLGSTWRNGWAWHVLRLARTGEGMEKSFAQVGLLKLEFIAWSTI